MRLTSTGSNVLWLLLAVSLVALLCYRLRLSATETVASLIVLAISILPIGRLLVGRLKLPASERLVLAALVGYPASSALFYGLNRVGVPAAFPGLVLLLAVREALAQRGSFGRFGAKGMNGRVLALLAVILLAALHDRRPWDPVADGAVYRYIHRDDFVHQAFYFEMLRGIPPAQMPYAAGVPFPPYHVLPYMQGIILMQYGGLTPDLVHHAVLPTLHLALFFAAAYLGLRCVSGSACNAASALVLLFFASRTFRLLRGQHAVVAMDIFRLSETVSAGVLVFATVLCLLALHEERSTGHPDAARMLYLAGLVAGLSLFVKAQVFLFVAPALGIALLLAASRRGSRQPLIALGLMGLTAGALFLSWQAPSQLGRVAYEPGALARELGLLRRFNWLPWGLGLFPASLAALWQQLNYPLLLPIYGLWRAIRSRTLGLATVTLLAILPVGFMFVSVLTISENYGKPLPFYARVALESLWLFFSLADLAIGCCWLGRADAAVQRRVLAGALVGAAAFGALVVKRELGEMRFGGAELSAFAFLRENTRPDSVVAHVRGLAYQESDWLNRYGAVSALAGRRCVLEYVLPAVDPEQRRARDLRRLFTTTDVQEGEELLARYNVTHVLEYPQRPLRFASRWLATVYQREGIRILERIGPGRAASSARTAGRE